MVQAGGILIEGWTIAARRCPPNQDSGAAPDAINDALAPNQCFHSEEKAKILPEWNAALGVIHRKLNVRDPVDLYAQLLCPLDLHRPCLAGPPSQGV